MSNYYICNKIKRNLNAFQTRIQKCTFCESYYDIIKSHNKQQIINKLQLSDI